MEALRCIIDKASLPLVIEIPESYKDKKVEVIVMPLDDGKEQFEKVYDFSDLFGRLEWKGDPLAEQKKLRDEWE